MSSFRSLARLCQTRLGLLLSLACLGLLLASVSSLSSVQAQEAACPPDTPATVQDETGRACSAITFAPPLTRRLVLPLLFRRRTNPIAPRATPTRTPTRVPTRTPTPRPPAPTSTPTTGSFEQRVIQLTNAERARAGCPPLRTDSRLMLSAERHSADMAHNDFFSHTGSNGSTPWDRMRAAGYNFSNAAENIGAGYSTPEEAMAGWMNSAPHRASILNCSLDDIGVGYVYLANDQGSVNHRHYWTQNFGSP